MNFYSGINKSKIHIMLSLESYDQFVDYIKHLGYFAVHESPRVVGCKSHSHIDQKIRGAEQQIS